MVEAPMRAAIKISPIVNEGPVGPDFRLENTMTIAVNKFKPLGQVRFDIPKPFIEAFEPPETKARRIWEEVRHQPSLTSLMVERVFLVAEAMGRSRRFYGWAQADLEYVTSVLDSQSVEAEAKGLDKTIAGFPIPHAQEFPHAQERKIAQAIFTKRVEQKTGTHLEASNESEIEFRRKRFVLDEQTQNKRVNLVIEAVSKAKEQALRLGVKITGSMIGKYLVELFSRQNAEVESEAVKGKGSDGSIPELEETILSHGEFASEGEAEQVSLEETYAKPPVKISQDGHPVTKEDVDRVYKKHQIKPKTEFVVSVFKKRQIKKGPGPAEVVESGEVESNIEDYPQLAGVFNFNKA